MSAAQRIPAAKPRGEPSLAGSIFCAIFNTLLGAILGFATLAATPAKEYKPTPDPKTGKPPPLPTAVWYWPGGGSGDWRGKEALFLADKPAEVVITEGDLNSWALANMKGAAPISKTAKPAPKPAAPPPPANAPAGQKKDAPAADTGPTFDYAPGTPNFHIYPDPTAPASAAPVFQAALPVNVTFLGVSQTVVLQVRGTFTAGADGPEFQPYFCAFGSARIPAPLARTILKSVSASLEKKDDGKEYVTAWAKFGGATLRDGELVLAGK